MAKLIAKGAPTAVREALAVIRRVPDLSLADAYDAETAAGAAALTSGEPLEGIQAFFEKRDPRWPEEWVIADSSRFDFSLPRRPARSCCSCPRRRISGGSTT
jgi:hypothetical protein